MMSNNKIKLLLIGLIGFVLCLITTYIFIKYKNDSQSNIYEATEDQTKDLISQDDCNDVSRILNEGSIWVFPGEEFDAQPRLVLTKEGKFQLFDWVEEGYIAEGSWNYKKDQKAIEFTFDNLDKYWQDLLSDNPKQYFQDVIDYNLSKKSVLFKIDYFERKEDFTGDCKDRNYYISIFNNLFYYQGLEN